MKIDQTIDRAIDERLVKKNKLRDKLHTPSGKLSAGKLGHPIQWQVLHTIGVPSKEIDPYVLRKFARGDDVEDWLVEFIPDLVAKQQFLEYRDVVGYADVVVDTKDYDFNVGVVPVEIKSTTNASYKWIKNGSGPKEHHVLQAACYALGMEVDHALLIYVASDDYRIKCYVIDAKDYKNEIDKRIDEYNHAKKLWDEKGVIPEFEPRAKWQEKNKYNNYREFAELSSKEASLLAKRKLEEAK